MIKTVVKETEDGELYIEVPVELLEEMGWDENTELEWTESDNNTFIVTKVEKNAN